MVIKIKITDRLSKYSIPIGRTSEYNVTHVIFDMSEYASEYGDLNPTMTFETPNGEAFPCVLGQEGNELYWDVMQEHTQVKGFAKARLIWHDTELRKKTAEIICQILDGGKCCCGDIPDPVQSWLDSVDEERDKLIAEGKKFTEEAKESSIASEDAKNEAKCYAEEARRSATSAYSATLVSGNHVHDAKAEADRARASATEAQASASTSGASASIAVENANKAMDEANKSKGYADNAKAFADSSASSANTAISNATKATNEATKAKGYADNAKSYADASATSSATSGRYAQEASNALQELKDKIASGNFKGEKGDKGDKGDSYVITDEDYQAIADKVEAEYTEQLSSLSKRVDNIGAVVDEKLIHVEKKVDALWKINEGQTYDIESQTEHGMMNKPVGAEYVTMEEVRGKSEQETANGYQLIPFPYTENTKNINGITFAVLEDGGLQIKGTATANSNFNIYGNSENTVHVDAGTTLTLSGNKTGSTISEFRFGIMDNTTGTYNLYYDTGEGVSKAFSVDSKIWVFAEVRSGYTIDTIIYPMLEKGSAAHEYEPYTGGIPSPSPEYPQEIKSVEEINVKVMWKNLFDKEGYDGIKTYFLNGSCDTAGVTPADVGIAIPLNYVGDITVSIGSVASRLRIACVESLPIPGYAVSTIASTKKNADGMKTASIVSTANSRFLIINVADETYFDKLQIEYGNKATPYEPYVEPITHTITPPRPLNKIGDYADICDVENGVWEWNVRSVLLASLSWSKPLASATLFRAPLNHFDFQTLHKLPNLITERYHRVTVKSNNADIYASGDMAITCQSSYIGVFINDSRFTNVREFSKSLDDLTMIYASGTPTTEPINESDLEFLRSLELTSSDNTIIVTDQNGEDVEWLAEYIINLRKVGA